MTSVHGGPGDLLDKPEDYLQRAPIIEPVFVKESGFLSATACRDIGLVVVELGGGRRKSADQVNHSVGLTQIAPIGTQLDNQTPMCLVHAASKDDFEQAKSQLLKAVTVANQSVKTNESVITEIIG